MEKFISDPTLKHRRTSGRELSHISYGNGSFSFEGRNTSVSDSELAEIRAKHGYIEPPLNWSRPIFAQRRYWAQQGK